MNPYSTPSEKPKTSYVFHVVVQAFGILSPVATIIEMPPKNKFWSRVSPLWIADRTRLIYKFLSSNDPESRFKLQTEVDLAIEQNTQHQLWFREKTKEIRDGPNTVGERHRVLAMQDTESIIYPYTTFGIKKCLEGQGAPGVDGDDVSLPTKSDFWTPGSLRTIIKMDAKYTIVVFDITDLGNIAYAVSDPTGRGSPAAMEQHCALEIWRDRARHPVIAFFDNIPVIEPRWIGQLFVENKELKKWAAKDTKRDKPTLSEIFKQHRSSIPGPELGREMVDHIFGDSVRLASIADLTCKDVVQVVRSASKVVSLSISSRVVADATNADLRSLVTTLASLPSLVVVYIAAPVLPPKESIFVPLTRSVTAQARFFERVRLESKDLWWKVQGSSMYFCAMNKLLHLSLQGECVEAMELMLCAHSI